MELPVDQLREEAAWVAQALSGDPRAFARLVERYHAPVERLLRAIVRNTEDAEDLLQETFLRAYRFLHRFDRSRPFGPWIMRIGANLAKNHLRSRRAHEAVSLDAAPDGEDDVYEGDWIADDSFLRAVSYRELLEAARRAMADLRDEYRIVIEMRVIGEMSYEEIASALRIPVGTVMSRLNRARRHVQQALSEYSARSEKSAEGSRTTGAVSEATSEEQAP